MSVTYLIAFICYGLYALVSILSGMVFLTRSTFMPFHQEALGKTWEQVDPNVQALLLGLMRSAGGGLMTSGIGVAILLFIPFRAEATWATYSIPAIGLLMALPVLYSNLFIRSRTQAHMPVTGVSMGVGLIVVGFIMSII